MTINVLQRTQRLEVDAATQAVTITNAGPVGPGGDVDFGGAQNPSAQWTFDLSPVVPNPADATAGASVSLDEVLDRMMDEPVLDNALILHEGSLGPNSLLFPVDNTTTKSPLHSAKSIPKPATNFTAELRVFGTVKNNSGSPITFTFTVENVTNSDVWATVAVSVPSENVQRGFKLVCDLAVNESLSEGVYQATDLRVFESTNPRLFDDDASLAQALSTITDPMNIMTYVQMSAAHADAEVRTYGAVLKYTFPDA